MLFFLTQSYKEFTIKLFLETLGRHLAPRVQLVSYSDLFRRRRLPAGTYIFADLERLSPSEADNAAAIWLALRRQFGPDRLLNHPCRSFRRFQLLRNLHSNGTNPYNVHRLTDPAASYRYPVFIRSEREHTGSLSPLIHSSEEFARAVADLEERGLNREDKIVVEFVDTADARGRYTIHHAFVVGNRIIPSRIEQSEHWINKGAWEAIAGAEFRTYLNWYRSTNPHQQFLERVFSLAHIEYGRIDYALVDGRPCVFEINTNPYVIEEGDLLDARWTAHVKPVAEVFADALLAVDAPAARAWIQAPARRTDPVRGSYRFRMRLHRVLRRTGLIRFEWRVLRWLRYLERRFLTKESEARHTSRSSQ